MNGRPKTIKNRHHIEMPTAASIFARLNAAPNMNTPKNSPEASPAESMVPSPSSSPKKLSGIALYEQKRAEFQAESTDELQDTPRPGANNF